VNETKRWKLERHGYETSYLVHAFIKDEHGIPVCGLWWPDGDAEAFANALKLAATEDLLEACKGLLESVNSGQDDAICRDGLISRDKCRRCQRVDAARLAAARAEIHTEQEGRSAGLPIGNQGDDDGF